MVSVGGHLRRLTSLRWIAALAVFVHHSLWLSSAHIETALGSDGVSFFFVLSGVVLTWSARPGQTARQFWRRRFARIYPATLVSGLIAAVLVAGNVTLMKGGTLGAWTNALLIQSWWPDGTYPVAAYNAVTWSLACEAFFYALFPFLLWLARQFTIRAFTIFAAASVSLTYIFDVGAPDGGWGRHLPILRLSEFLVGIAVGLALRRGWVPRVRAIYAAPVYVFMWVLSSAINFSWLPLLPAVALLICAVAGSDLRGEAGLLTSRPLVYLGELSFCFYLTHQMALRLTREWMDGPTWIVAALGLAVSSAVVLHHGIELPMQEVILRKSRHLQATQPVGVA